MPKTVLIIDDDASIRDCLAEVLGSRGLNVVQMDSAENALALLLKKKPAAIPALVVLDNVLPGMNGIELLELLEREHGKLFENLSFLLFSASKDMAVTAGKAARERVRFLAKPVELEALIHTVDAMLELEPSALTAASARPLDQNGYSPLPDSHPRP